jgi:hypothetical protein
VNGSEEEPSVRPNAEVAESDGEFANGVVAICNARNATWRPDLALHERGDLQDDGVGLSAPWPGEYDRIAIRLDGCLLLGVKAIDEELQAGHVCTLALILPSAFATYSGGSNEAA